MRLRMTFYTVEQLYEVEIFTYFQILIVEPSDLIIMNSAPYFDPAPPTYLSLEICSKSEVWFYDLPEALDADKGDVLSVSVDLVDSLAFLDFDNESNRLFQISRPDVGNYTVAVIVED